MLKTIITRVMLIILMLCFVGPSWAKMRSANKLRAGTPPYEIIKTITTTNNQAVKHNASKKTSGFSPYMTWLTDPDPRITRNSIMPASSEIFTVRNMGSQLETSAGSIDYGVRHLLTPLLLVTVNSDNQAIKFFLKGHSTLSPDLRRELDHLHLAIPKVKKTKSPETLLRQSIEANVDFQVRLAVERYQDRVQSGRLVIVGSILDLTNTYKRGEGRLIIININNERDSKKLRSLQLLKTIDPKFANLYVGREITKKKKKK